MAVNLDRYSTPSDRRRKRGRLTLLAPTFGLASSLTAGCGGTSTFSVGDCVRLVQRVVDHDLERTSCEEARGSMDPGERIYLVDEVIDDADGACGTPQGFFPVEFDHEPHGVTYCLSMATDGNEGPSQNEAAPPAPVPQGTGTPPASIDMFRDVEVNGIPLPTTPEPGSTGGAATDRAVGAQVPLMAGTDYIGTPITLGGPTGRSTLVVVVTHWSPHSRNLVVEIQQWLATGGVPDGLDVVLVNSGARSGRDDPQTWLGSIGWDLPVLADDADQSAFRAFGLSYFPSLLLIGTDGTVQWRTSGEQSAAEIEALVSGSGVQ